MFGKLFRYWKILRETNLEAIREQAERPLRLAVVADGLDDVADARSLLVGPSGVDDPRLVPVAAEDAPAVLERRRPDLALLVSRGARLEGSLAAARDALAEARVPIVTALVGSFGYFDGRKGRGERRRVVVSSLEAGQWPTVVDALFGAAGADRRLALARQFEGVRPRAFEVLIEETARANASYAFSTGLAETIPVLDVPLNIGDIVILTKNQIIMAYRLALAAGKRGRPREIVTEIAGVLGGGLLFRQTARELVGLVPVIGIVPKVAVAYGGTWTIGQAVVLWATSGERSTRATLRRLYAAGLRRGRHVARQLTSHRRAA